MLRANTICLLGLLLSLASASTTTNGLPTGTFEIDIVFPRPTTAFVAKDPAPIVFAVQNYDVAVASQLVIYWQLFIDNPAVSTDSGFIYLIPLGQKARSDISTPYFMVGAIENLQNRTANGILRNTTWIFQWSLYLSLCNSTDYDSPTQRWLGGYPPAASGNVTFSTDVNGTALDLVAATAADTCASSQNFVFDVASNEQWTPSGTNLDRSCVNLKSTKSDGDPCAVSINVTSATELWAMSTDAACQWYNLTGSNSEPPKLNCSAWRASLQSQAGHLETFTSAWLSSLMMIGIAATIFYEAHLQQVSVTCD